MKILKTLKILPIVTLAAVTSCSFTSKKFDNPDKDKLLIDLISYVLERGHFSPKEMDDAFSENVFHDFIDNIDPLRRYFYDSDIKEFAKYKHSIDDQIKNKDLEFFNVVYTRLMTRMDEAEVLSKEILKTPFDYSISENINVDYENLSFVGSKSEMKERWRKQLKYSTISSYDDEFEDDKRKEKKTKHINPKLKKN